jgi:hypothetical protein
MVPSTVIGFYKYDIPCTNTDTTAAVTTVHQPVHCFVCADIELHTLSLSEVVSKAYIILKITDIACNQMNVYYFSASSLPFYTSSRICKQQFDTTSVTFSSARL